MGFGVWGLGFGVWGLGFRFVLYSACGGESGTCGKDVVVVFNLAAMKPEP